MATYKVIQDIEAEDKLLGPLSLRQFIYAAIVVVAGFIAFRLLFVAWWLVLPLIPPMILFGMLAAPFGHDQPSEVWLLAKIRFFLKPRRRIWDQSGVKELVTITAPKRIERALTKNLSQAEVRSRLQALANTIDSRGWAIKNVNVNMFAQPSYLAAQQSDRLIDPNTIPQEVPSFDVAAVEDMLDERSNPTAQNLDRMISASAQNRRQELMSRMQKGEEPESQRKQEAPVDYWFLNGTAGQQTILPGYSAFTGDPAVTSGVSGQATVTNMTPEEEALLAQKLRATHDDTAPQTYGHMKVIQPLEVQEKQRKAKEKTKADEAARKAREAAEAAATQAQNTPMKTPSDPVILELANNDDLNVATIARQAKKREAEKFDGEVVIQLH